MPTNEMKEATGLLAHKLSSKRRSGARRLRKLKDPNACAFLLEALQKEVNDLRTWETQYQMIMALGECNCKAALPFIQALASRQFDATILYLAIGDAIVRLARRHKNDSEPVLRLLQTENEMLIDGAIRAVAMLHLKLKPESVKTIIEYGSKLEAQHANRFWIAAAAAGWDGLYVEQFLHECVASGGGNIERAALASLKKKYLNWRPL